jgi:ferredoxin-type protein NapG
MKLTRRQMLKRTAGAATIAGGAAVVGHVLMSDRDTRYPLAPGQYAEAGVRLIRPPGAVPEDDFLAGCIRCYKCQDACEPGAIQFFTETAGKHFHTPYIDPSSRGCTLCMKCTKVCPTNVLRVLDWEDRAEVDMATVELRHDLCLSYKAKRLRDEQAMLAELGKSPTESTADAERRGPCGECYTVCPLRRRAIKLEPGAFLAPIVFQDECVGCGMCEEICRMMVKGQPAIRIVSKRGTV